MAGTILKSFRDKKVGENQSDYVYQPRTTYLGTPISPRIKGLPKETQSLCPECTAILPATVFEEDGGVYMVKTCPDHGEFKDIVWSDVKMYRKMEEYDFGDNRGIMNPKVTDAKVCPSDCGLCNIHTSHTSLANIDLTNRCNLTCPICFANANAAGYLYEPSFDQVLHMLQALRDERPVAGRIIQFSGGEPTVYPRFFDALRAATDLGFSHIQIATNGIKFADLEFAEQSREAGLHTLYLQFDGVTDDVYRGTRGESLVDIKFKAMENVRKAGLKIVFVPTIVRGLNDHQVGDILQVALDNIDIMSGISYQPVTFTGRISSRERMEKRFTLTDLARCIEEQTGLIGTPEDWFPLSCTTPFSRLLGVVRGEETVTLSCHNHCSIGTYLFVDQDGNSTPVTQFVDVPALFRKMNEIAEKSMSSKLKSKNFMKAKSFHALKKYFDDSRAPKGLTFTRFLQTLDGFVDHKKGRGKLDGLYTYKTLLVAGMHFMDSYNYDVERVKRCVIHYSAPDGTIYPFCTYNSGPVFREKVEKEFSRSREEVLRLAEEEGNPKELQWLVKKMK
jgi:uncharacterized radical SAM superfamily Fe-S cluster-containing enzyme